MSVEQLLERKDRPAYVRFERLAIEDKPASLAAGHYVAKDVDYALVTPPYSKDVFKQKVDAWLENLEREVQSERVPQEWVDLYKQSYQAWKNGQELPLHGTPIKGWGVISPAHQETLIRLNILTVEDLALVNDEGQKRIGMGSVDLRNKAKAWLDQLNDKGPLTLKMAALENENALQKSSIDILVANVAALTAQVSSLTGKPVLVETAREESVEISASDILDEPPKRGPGRPKKDA